MDTGNLAEDHKRQKDAGDAAGGAGGVLSETDGVSIFMKHVKLPVQVTGEREERGIYLPRIGRRIIKTAAAVFFCLIIYAIRGFEGETMPTEAAITAIICLQHDVRDTGTFAFNRFAGTLVGTLWGILLLLLLIAVPALGRDQILLYALMAAGIMMSLYTTVVLRITDASNLAAIVFLCIVIAFPEIEDPFGSAAQRVLDVFIGTTAAIFVNVLRLPRRKDHSKMYFLRSGDMVADRFAQIPPAVLYHLNMLYDDGAKICLMSEHAPAFFTMQMSQVRLNMPLIVMDGAGIYDAEEDVYLHTEAISEEDSSRLRSLMDREGIRYFTYTVHNNKTCIFHRGELSLEEKMVMDRLKRSPYRSYLDGEIYHASEIVYFKIVGDERTISRAQEKLHPILSRQSLRTRLRYQAGTTTVLGLYIYSGSATMDRAKDWLMARVWKENHRIMPVEFSLPRGYQSEHEALNLLHRVEDDYEPVSLWQDETPGRGE